MTDLSAEDGPPTDPRDQIATEMLRVHEDSYGVGAGAVVVHLLGDLVIVVLDRLELAPSEKTLLAGGYDDVVENMRSAFQREIEPTFTAIVERATGRRVSAFLSNTSLPSLFSVEFFRLA